MKSITIFFFCLLNLQLFGQQGVGISTDNSDPAPSAMLHVKSTNSGLLIPRMTEAQKNAIAAPATGLLVYQNDISEGFYYFDGTNWAGMKSVPAWSLTGNAGTTAGTNFIGTTDAQALEFRTNNVLRTRISTKGQIEVLNTGRSVFVGERAGASDDLSDNRNVFVGYEAGMNNSTGIYNTANGTYALYSNTTGNYNSANGYYSLSSNTTGRYNSANGTFALRSNTTGIQNTANGAKALRNNITGNYNSANGYASLYLNTTGTHNTANGCYALYRNTIGNSNTANGTYALYSNTTGNYNSANGYESLNSNTTGSYNTANGYYSLFTNTTGSYNTANGYEAFRTGSDYSNSTALGYNSVITASDQIRLGNSNVTSIGGFTNWTNVSDARFKTNINENVAGLDFINQLRPVTYNLDMDAIADFHNTPDSLRLFESEAIKAKQLQTGFIAQEVEAAAKKSGYDFSGVDAPKNEKDHYGLRYAEFTVPLVKAVQQLSEENELLKARIQELEEKALKTDALEKEISEIKALLNK